MPELPPTMVFRPRLQNIFEENFNFKKIIYVSAHTGWGKTTAVAEWLIEKNHEAIWFCLEEYQKENVLEKLLTEISRKNANQIIVIDDYSMLDDKELDCMNRMVTQSNRRFVIISKAELPRDLVIYVGLTIQLIGVDQLRFTEEETEQYFERWNVNLSEQDIYQLVFKQKGWVINYRYAASLMQATGEAYTKEIRLKVLEAMYRYLDVKILGECSEREREIILAIGCFDKITSEQADILLGTPEAHITLESFTRKGHFLTFMLPDVYILHPFFKEYLTYSRKNLLSEGEINSIYKTAGEYFENRKAHSMALECYAKAGEHEGVKRILVTLSRQAVGQAVLWQNRKYYYDLPEELIKEDPSLCCGMAMLSLIGFHLEAAERWKNQLENLLRSLPPEDERINRIYDKIVYLSIVTPSSGLHIFLRLLKNWPKRVEEGNAQLQLVNVTGNRPSVLNGERDFSPWLKKVNLLKEPMNKGAISLYGDAAIGVVDVASAECFYQQDRMQEALIQVAGILSLIEQKGNISTLFAAMYVEMQVMLVSGQFSSAKD